MICSLTPKQAKENPLATEFMTSFSEVAGIRQVHGLLIDRARGRFPAVDSPAQELVRQCRGVLTNQEKAPAIHDAEEKARGAEVAIPQPQIPRLHLRQDRAEQGAFLGVAVFPGDDIDHQAQFRVQRHQRLTRRRRRPHRPQFLEPMLGPGQMVAVENPHPKARQHWPEEMEANDTSNQHAQRVSTARQSLLQTAVTVGANTTVRNHHADRPAKPLVSVVGYKNPQTAITAVAPPCGTGAAGAPDHPGYGRRKASQAREAFQAAFTRQELEKQPVGRECRTTCSYRFLLHATSCFSWLHRSSHRIVVTR